MADPDIHLGQDSTRAIDLFEVSPGKNGKPTIKLDPGVSGGPGDSRVHIHGGDGRIRLGQKRTGDEDWDISLWPKYATLSMGGGAGDNSDGDVKLQNREGKTRIHLTGGKGDGNNSTRVEIRGNDAEITLSGGEENEPRVHLTGRGIPRPNTPDVPANVYVSGREKYLGIGEYEQSNGLFGRPIALRASQSQVALASLTAEDIDMTDDVMLRLGRMEPAKDGGLTMFFGGELGVMISDGVFRLGNEKEPGQFRLTDERNQVTVDATGKNAQVAIGDGNNAGNVKLINDEGNTGAEIRADDGQFVSGGLGSSGKVVFKTAKGNPAAILTAAGGSSTADDTLELRTIQSPGGSPSEKVAMRIGRDGKVEFPQGTK